MSYNDMLNQWRLGAAAALALMVLATGCSSSEEPSLESLNLAIAADIQAGETFEVAVPSQSDTLVAVETTPAGVTAAITDDSEAGTMLLTVNVEFDTPRGAYNLGLSVVRDGKEFLVGWPFEVIDPGGAAPSSGDIPLTRLST